MDSPVDAGISWLLAQEEGAEESEWYCEQLSAVTTNEVKLHECVSASSLDLSVQQDAVDPLCKPSRTGSARDLNRVSSLDSERPRSSYEFDHRFPYAGFREFTSSFEGAQDGSKEDGSKTCEILTPAIKATPWKASTNNKMPSNKVIRARNRISARNRLLPVDAVKRPATTSAQQKMARLQRWTSTEPRGMALTDEFAHLSQGN